MKPIFLWSDQSFTLLSLWVSSTSTVPCEAKKNNVGLYNNLTKLYQFRVVIGILTFQK